MDSTIFRTLRNAIADAVAPTPTLTPQDRVRLGAAPIPRGPAYEPPANGVTRSAIRRFAKLTKLEPITSAELKELREAESRWQDLTRQTVEGSFEAITAEYRRQVAGGGPVPDPSAIVSTEEALRRSKLIRQACNERKRVISRDLLPLRKRLQDRLRDIGQRAAKILEETERNDAAEMGLPFTPSEGLRCAWYVAHNAQNLIDAEAVVAGMTPLAYAWHLLPD